MMHIHTCLMYMGSINPPYCTIYFCQQVFALYSYVSKFLHYIQVRLCTQLARASASVVAMIVLYTCTETSMHDSINLYNYNHTNVFDLPRDSLIPYRIVCVFQAVCNI